MLFYKKQPGAVFAELGCALGDPEGPSSMFATVMCTASLDGDRRADLLLGAPAFSAGADLYEIGAVYVYRGMACANSADAKV